MSLRGALSANALKEQFVGTWMLVLWEQKRGEGTKVERYGANPTGIAFLDAGRRYIVTVMRSDRARHEQCPLAGYRRGKQSNGRWDDSYFGTYSVSEADSSIAIHIDGSSFPNWNGDDQKRFVAIVRDQLTLTVHPRAGRSSMSLGSERSSD